MEIIFLENEQKLSLIGQDLQEIPAALAEEYGPKVKRLDLSYNKLRTLNNLAKFTLLDSLVIDYNDIQPDPGFPSLPSLRTLSLNSNNITDLAALLPNIAKSFPHLTFLSLLKNPACPNELTGKDQEDYQRYRIFVIFRMPSLKFLDSSPVTEWERGEAKRVGHLTGVVVRPSEDAYKKPAAEPESDAEQFRGLPEDLRPLESGGVTSFGRTKYVYIGRQSEGNRFILNTDL